MMNYRIERNSIKEFSKLELFAKQVVEGFITGLHKSPFHGFSVEFAEHRLYNKGESTKYIDWKLYGRTDKLFVKRYEEETNLRCRIIIDNSSSMYYPQQSEIKEGEMNKISFSVHAAAALMTILYKQRDAVGLSLFSDKIELHTQTRSNQTHHKHLFDQLEKIIQPDAMELNKHSMTYQSIHEVSEKIHKRSLVVIFSDMFNNDEHLEEQLSALQHLRHNKHEVIFFHVVDESTELDFDFSHRPYRFIDLESGSHIKLNPADVKEKYAAKSRRLRDDLKLKCAQYGIDYVAADTKQGFKQILLPYLMKRKKLY